MMGFKSRSTPGGGGFCEMVIHDQKGKELVNIHSQKDMVTTVQNNQATVVNGPQQTNTVANGFHVTTVKQKVDITSETEHVHLTAATDITLEVGQSKIVLKADGTILIQGVQIAMEATKAITIKGGEEVEVLGKRIDLNK
jgi:type VI secretion system secreted protein VgrG